MTPELRPVWCRAIPSSLSRTTTGSDGWARRSARAVASPTMPAPMTTAWWSTARHHARRFTAPTPPGRVPGRLARDRLERETHPRQTWWADRGPGAARGAGARPSRPPTGAGVGAGSAGGASPVGRLGAGSSRSSRRCDGPAPSPPGAGALRRVGDVGARALAELSEEIVGCRACPRLVAWREEVALRSGRRSATRSMGPPCRLPATPTPGSSWWPGAGGRLARADFGDRWATLRRATGPWRPAAGGWRCATVSWSPRPGPGNQPTPEEARACRPFLERELAALEQARVYVALGGFAYAALASVVGLRPPPALRPRHRSPAARRAGRSSARSTRASRTPSPEG